jgi:hypothetical protein
MSTSVEAIRGLFETRRQREAPAMAQRLQVKQLYNAELAVPLPELDDNEMPAVTNLLKQGIDGTAQRINSTLPDVWFPPAKPGQKTAEANAELARRATLGWWQHNDMTTVLGRRVRHFLGYSIAPVVLRPDTTWRHARWEVRDPLSCYAAPTVFDSCTPTDAIFTFTRSVSWLQQCYPTASAGLYLNGHDPMVQILEFHDATETVLMALGQDKDPQVYNTYGAPQVELARAPNLAGICPVVIPNRIALDRAQGQFDGLIPMYFKQAKLDALEYIAIEQGIFPRQWLVGRQGETPDIKVMADGRKGILGVVKGGDIHNEVLNPGYKTTEAIDRLASEQRLEGNVPAEMQGVSGSNIRTGRRGDEVLANGIDFGIQEAQRILETSLREENRRAVAISKAWFGNEQHSFFVSWRGATGPLTYVPNQVFTSDHNVVKYALAGSDLNGQVVRTGQKLGAGLISKMTARRNDPEINDPDFEDHQIVAEQAETAFLQGLSQQMASGQFPPADAAEFVRLVKTEKLEPIEAFARVQAEAQKRQATTSPTPAEAPTVPTEPAAQPGVSPGSEAGVPIGPPPTAIDNMKQILRNAGTVRSSARAS